MNGILTLEQELPMTGISASLAARLAAKSQGIDLDDPYGSEAMFQAVMANLKSQGIDAEPAFVKSVVAQTMQSGSLVTKATDPLILPQPFVAPADFTAQYPNPLDPTEILTLCEEVSTWKALPEVVTDYQADQIQLVH